MQPIQFNHRAGSLLRSKTLHPDNTFAGGIRQIFFHMLAKGPPCEFLEAMYEAEALRVSPVVAS